MLQYVTYIRSHRHIGLCFDIYVYPMYPNFSMFEVSFRNLGLSFDVCFPLALI